MSHTTRNAPHDDWAPPTLTEADSCPFDHSVECCEMHGTHAFEADLMPDGREWPDNSWDPAWDVYSPVHTDGSAT